MSTVERIHHISATVGDPNENLHFYQDILGLRLVKKTVNFEDNGTYHLYFANDNADDGSVITFFPRLDNLEGRTGAGQVGRIAFSIPKETINQWKIQLEENGIHYIEENNENLSQLLFNDFHGLPLALVETDKYTEEINITGFYGVELLSEHPDKTYQTLLNDMGLQLIATTPEYYLLEMAGKERHKVLINRLFTKRGRLGIGTVHHIAWSVKDSNELRDWKELFEQRFNVTEIKDRKYFKSIYFRDSGRIIYEMATNGPGFTVDEPLETLGSKLMLPAQYENQRTEIEASLPELF